MRLKALFVAALALAGAVAIGWVLPAPHSSKAEAKSPLTALELGRP